MDQTQLPPKRPLVIMDYLGILVFATAAPLIGLWIQSDGVLRQGIRLYQALALYFDHPALWVVLLFEMALGCTAFFLLRGLLHRGVIRWSVFAALCLIWTYVAYGIMSGVHR